MLYTKDSLSKMSSDELKNICKTNSISIYKGHGRLNKNEMIEKIMELNSEVHDEENKEWENKSKEVYIEDAEVGTLIAFKDNKGKPRTAALVNRSSSRKLVKVVTEFGWEFIVPYENVLWVKKGNRWPKGVYNMLKGYSNGK